MRKDKLNFLDDIQYSLRKHVEDSTGIKCYFEYDGFKEADLEKPYALLRQDDVDNEIVSKGRERVTLVPYYYLTFKLRDPMELARVQGEYYQSLLFEDIPYIRVADMKQTHLMDVNIIDNPYVPRTDVSEDKDRFRTIFVLQVRETFGRN